MGKNSIMDNLFYDNKKGSLLYKGTRYLLIRPETIIGFLKAVEESLKDEAGEKFYLGGFRGGFLSTKRYKEIHNFSDKEIIEFMMKMGAEIGWGKFSLMRYEPKENILEVSVENSPFAIFYGRSDKGVCHLIRGVISGMATALFGKDCQAEEISCIAKGDNRCVFVVRKI